MKSNLSSSQGVALSHRKLLSFFGKIRTLSLTEVLWCLAAAFLSRGAVFGVLYPFGLALYAAYAKSMVVKSLMTVFIFIGSIAGGDFGTALKHIAAIFLYEWLKKLIPGNEQEEKPFRNALFMGGAAAVTGVLVFIIHGKTLESLLVVIMEVVLVSAVASIFLLVISDEGTFSTAEYPGQRNLKFLGILILGGTFLLGLSGIQIFEVKINHIAAGAILLMLSKYFGPGFGACAGAVAGVTLSAGIPESFTALISVYTIAGIVAGMLQKSKAAVGAGFILVHAVFMVTTFGLWENWPEMIFSVFIFFLVPDLKPGKLLRIRNKIEGEAIEPQKMIRFKKAVSARLSDMAKALYKMGFIMEKQIRYDSENMQDNGDAIIEQLTGSVCYCCNKASVCWEEKLFHTYKVMRELANSLEEDNAVKNRRPEHDLGRFCIKPSVIIDTLLRIIEIKRIEKVWQGTVYECRSILPGQIYSLSEIISGISGEVFDNMEHYIEEERKINAALRKQGYPAFQVEVQRSGGKRFAIEIRLEDCSGHKNCLKQIEEIVTGVLGVPVQTEDEGCKGSGRDVCFFLLKEKEGFSVTTGIARLKKDKANVSGDSFTFLKTKEGKYVVAISDGMGNGRSANRLSETAIGLLEQLLDCGLSIRRALSLINMILQVKECENYTTMDISSVDLYTGDTEFYKMGAVPSILLKEQNTTTIQANNLPAGLQQESLVRPEKTRIVDGEFIIMMTDGVYDRFKGERALEKIIRKKKTLNPQELAEYILHNAATDNVPDDMTVLVAKLWKKTG